jgi:pyruvate dehydrogenase E2 component (dihydrolipoamide acetyltransferase)
VASAVHLPKVGMTMEEGELIRWLVPDGETVVEGQPIFEMETEKVEMEVECDGAGVLRQLVAPGAKLEPGAIVGCLLAPGETEVPREILEAFEQQGRTEPLAEEPAAHGAAAGSPEPGADAAVEPRGRIVASPLARRLAAEHGIDLAQLTGTGPSGRITEADVRGRMAQAVEVSPQSDAAATPAPETGTMPYSGRRRAIGQRMRASLQEMAQLTLSVETTVEAATAMAHGLSREWREERVAVTLTALVARACALALREHPQLNARVELDQIVLEHEVHIGVAMDLTEGLIVTVLRDTDRRPLKAIATDLIALRERAQAGRLSLNDVTGSTFTVTSLEGLAVDAFTPVINPPQAAILGVGRVRDVARFEGERVVRARVTTLSLTFDHRVTDGAPAARFLGRVCELLDRPYLLM